MFKLLVLLIVFFNPAYGFSMDNKTFNELVSRSSVREVGGVFTFKSDYESLMKLAFKSYGGEVLTVKPFGLHNKSVLGASFEDFWRRNHNFSGMNVHPNIQLSFFYDSNERVKKVVIESKVSDLEVIQRGDYLKNEVMAIDFNYISKEISSVNFLRFWDSNAFKADLNNVSASMMRVDAKEALQFLKKSEQLFKSVSSKGFKNYLGEDTRFSYSNFRNNLSKTENTDLMNKVLSFLEQSNVQNNKAKNADFIDNKIHFEQSELYKRYKRSKYLRAIGLVTVFSISSLFLVEPNFVSGAVLSLVLWRFHSSEMEMSATDERSSVRYRDLTPKVLRNSLKRIIYFYYNEYQKMKLSLIDRFVGSKSDLGFITAEYQILNSKVKTTTKATCNSIF